ncbi:MAG: DUF177 domain-containing protein [Acidobacteriaceae bacterium]
MMQILFKDLELHPVEFDQEFSPEAVRLGDDLRLKAPLRAKGRADMIEENHGGKKVVRDIWVVGHFDAVLEADCDRCLDPVERKIGGDFEVLQRPQAENTGADEHEIKQGETEIGFYEGDSILLEDVLKEQVLLAMPAKTLCRENCKGLCPECGRNRNKEQCQCVTEFRDPRWAALGEIRKKLQN